MRAIMTEHFKNVFRRLHINIVIFENVVGQSSASLDSILTISIFVP